MEHTRRLGSRRRCRGERRAGVGKLSAKWPSGHHFEHPQHFLIVGGATVTGLARLGVPVVVTTVVGVATRQILAVM